MKQLIAILVLALSMNTVNAQKVKEAEVPAAVKSTFTKKYPDIKSPKWEKEGANYEAEFNLKKTETSVLIDPNGTIIETETEINVSELPKGVSDYITKNMPGKKIKEGSRIVDPKGTVTYEAEVDKVDYIFDSNGQFIKKNGQ